MISQATAEAREAVEAARRLLPSEAGIYARLGLLDALWWQDQVAEAEPILAEAIETAKQLQPSITLADAISFHAMKHAALQVWFGREVEHAALCWKMLHWAADQPNFAPKGRAAAMANLRPLADPQVQVQALALARQAAEAAPTNSLVVWYRLTLGVAEYRLGHYPEAERMLKASEEDGPSRWHPEARTGTAQFFRAMMLFQQGQAAAARQLFAEAVAKMPPLPAAVNLSLAEGSADYDELMLWLACKEARALLNVPPK